MAFRANNDFGLTLTRSTFVNSKNNLPYKASFKWLMNLTRNIFEEKNLEASNLPSQNPIWL